MVNRDHLQRRGLLAYALGRLRSGARAAWVVIPGCAICAFATGAGRTCACLGLLLLASALYLRWRDRRGAESVNAGLWAGSVPLAVGLGIERWAPGCANAPLFSACSALCLAVGLPAGIWLGLQGVRGPCDLTRTLNASAIAVLAASLGCVGLGVAGIAGATIGVLVGSLSAARAKRVA
jgi:hypothetical protein